MPVPCHLPPRREFSYEAFTAVLIQLSCSVNSVADVQTRTGINLPRSWHGTASLASNAAEDYRQPDANLSTVSWAAPRILPMMRGGVGIPLPRPPHTPRCSCAVSGDFSTKKQYRVMSSESSESVRCGRKPNGGSLRMFVRNSKLQVRRPDLGRNM